MHIDEVLGTFGPLRERDVVDLVLRGLQLAKVKVLKIWQKIQTSTFGEQIWSEILTVHVDQELREMKELGNL